MKKLISSFLIVLLIMIATTSYAIDLDTAKTYVGKKVSILANASIFSKDISFVGKIECILATKDGGADVNHYIILQEKGSLKLIRVYIGYILVIKEVEY